MSCAGQCASYEALSWHVKRIDQLILQPDKRDFPADSLLVTPHDPAKLGFQGEELARLAAPNGGNGAMTAPSQFTARRPQGIFAPHELQSMQSVIDAVCAELGVQNREMERRKAVADRVMSAYRRGDRHPLTLVQAGLSETSRPSVHP